MHTPCYGINGQLNDDGWLMMYVHTCACSARLVSNGAAVAVLVVWSQ